MAKTETKTKEQGKKNKGSFRKKFLKLFWFSFAGLLLVVSLIFTAINYGWIGYLPPIDELQNPKNKYATEIYSSDLQILGRFYYSENRVGVTYFDLSEDIVKALIATEDIRFHHHSGVDGKALLRAVAKMGRAGGGSTLTQQLAKQLYSGNAGNFVERFIQKLNEWVIAVKLERLYSKEEILTMYLNQYDFNYNAIGIKSAAQIYFAASPATLKIEESAMLIGMCKNSSLYNPVKRLELTQQRRNVVLRQMLKADYITEQEYDSLKTLPLALKFQRLDHKEGLAPYFREYLRSIMTAREPKRDDYASWQEQKYRDDLWEWENNPLFGFCRKNKKPDGSYYNIYNDGLKIYTTIDSRMQRYAEEAVNQHIQSLQKSFFSEKRNRSYAPFSRQVSKSEIESILNRSVRQSERYRLMKRAGKNDSEIQAAFDEAIPMRVFSYAGTVDTIMSPLDSIRYHKHFLRCGFMSMDAQSGHVKAYVGGPNFEWFQYDMVTQGRRQVGSTVKPFLYTLAMGDGLQPCHTAKNEAVTFILETGKPYTPSNTSKARIGETVSLNWGLANSNNWISAYLMSLTTPQALVNLMRSFGVRGHLDPVVSLCLGPCEISVAEMVDAYTAFPNKGIRVDPLYVVRIEDSNGNVIAAFTPRMSEIISESTSYKMISMLRAVVDVGTGVRVRYRYGLNMPMGGKTGTTQNNSDGWFMGFTPSLVSGVWVGGEDRSIHFDGMALGQGASTALPIWALYMKKVLDDKNLPYSYEEQFEYGEGYAYNPVCDVDRAASAIRVEE
jgi:penicillin-binding protein 1A